MTPTFTWWYVFARLFQFLVNLINALWAMWWYWHKKPRFVWQLRMKPVLTAPATRNVSRLNSAWQRTIACTAWHHLISPDSVHHLPSWPAANNCALLINTNCSFLVRLPPRWVLRRSAHRAHLRGTHFPGSFATQLSPSTSSDNPSKLICLTVFNCV